MYRFSVELRAGEAPYSGIPNLEIADGFFGAPLAEMTPDQLEDVREELIGTMQRIVLYTLSIPFSDKAAYLRAFRACALLHVEYVKLDLAALRDVSEQTLEQLREVIAMAAALDLQVVFEPGGACACFDAACYGRLRADNTGLIFNPAAYVQEGRNPFLQVMYKNKYRNDIRMLRVNDALYDGAKPVLPGHGNAEVKECASALLARGFDGYFSLAAYLPDDAQQEVTEHFLQMLCEM